MFERFQSTKQWPNSFLLANFCHPVCKGKSVVTYFPADQSLWTSDEIAGIIYYMVTTRFYCCSWLRFGGNQNIFLVGNKNLVNYPHSRGWRKLQFSFLCMNGCLLHHFPMVRDQVIWRRGSHMFANWFGHPPIEFKYALDLGNPLLVCCNDIDTWSAGAAMALINNVQEDGEQIVIGIE